MERLLSLKELPLNREAVVEEVNCDKSVINRIYDFGIIKGAVITPVFQSPFKDPTAYLINNSVVALRAKDCRKIMVKIEGDINDGVLQNKDA